jgi:hypothetical protein
MYLEILAKKGINPNFWTSQEYFDKAGWRENTFLEWSWIEDAEGMIMLPPLTPGPLEWRKRTPNTPCDFIWSDFEGYAPEDYNPLFLDLEYLYRTQDFKNLEGGEWRKFRKNVRKWPRKRIGLNYSFHAPRTKLVEDVFREWLGAFMDDTLYDPDLMAEYVFYGEKRRFLYEKDRLVGFNIWDSNYLYYNYRYCIHVNEPFLSEYLRLLFYTDQTRLNSTVNDGGTLGNEGLKRFKDSLNPARVRSVKSWQHKNFTL